MRLALWITFAVAAAAIAADTLGTIRALGRGARERNPIVRRMGPTAYASANLIAILFGGVAVHASQGPVATAGVALWLAVALWRGKAAAAAWRV